MKLMNKWVLAMSLASFTTHVAQGNEEFGYSSSVISPSVIGEKNSFFNKHRSYRVTSPTLTAFSYLPADTFAEGPSAGGNDGNGNPIRANGRQGPFDSQPVQGFSAVQFSPYTQGSFLFLSDNGFGSKANSSDYLLRLYEIDTFFARFGGKLEVQQFIQLSDPNNYIPFPIVNEDTEERLLTGADFDVESFVIDKEGNIWVGEEFGPYLLQFDENGVLLSAPIKTPQVVDGELDMNNFVMSPNSPDLGDQDANLRGSRGFEGMAFSPNRKTFYPLLEGTVKGDPVDSLRIYEVSAKTKQFVGFVGFYPTTDGHAIGDFTPINSHQFLVIERDGGQGDQAVFKKVFLIDFNHIDANGFVEKTELVDLMNIADPFDLNHDDDKTFTFPFVTIEDVLVLSPNRILVANDNNYPFSLGRGPDIDNNEVIEITLPKALDVDFRLFFPRFSWNYWKR